MSPLQEVCPDHPIPITPAPDVNPFILLYLPSHKGCAFADLFCVSPVLFLPTSMSEQAGLHLDNFSNVSRESNNKELHISVDQIDSEENVHRAWLVSSVVEH